MTNQQLGARTNAPSESDAERSFPPDETNVVDRLQSLMDGDSIAAFGRRCSVPESNLRSYLKRGVKPGLDHLVAIADTAGVTVDWLATGREPKLRRDLVAALRAAERGAPAGEAPAIDMERLAQALQAVEEGLQDADVELEPIDKAEVVCAAYDLIGQLGATAQARALIGRIVKAGR